MHSVWFQHKHSVCLSHMLTISFAHLFVAALTRSCINAQYSCIGEQFVTMEIALLLKEILTRYDVTRTSTENLAYFNPFVRFTDNLPLVFKPRA
jgi:hypothetical protein